MDVGIDSALKLAGLRGAMGAIAARRDHKEKPSRPSKARATAATAMRWIIAPYLNPVSLCQGRDKNSPHLRQVRIASQLQSKASGRINWMMVSATPK
jgi:hypothetical protein